MIRSAGKNKFSLIKKIQKGAEDEPFTLIITGRMISLIRIGVNSNWQLVGEFITLNQNNLTIKNLIVQNFEES